MRMQIKVVKRTPDIEYSVHFKTKELPCAHIDTKKSQREDYCSFFQLKREDIAS